MSASWTPHRVEIPETTRRSSARRKFEMSKRDRLLSIYEMLPFKRHPFWEAVRKRELSLDQVLLAEKQHYLRTKAGRRVRQQAVTNALAVSETLWRAVLDTYLEECTPNTGPSHLELIERLLRVGGVTDAELDETIPTPGNAAAISLYADIGTRGAPCHILGAGAVEFYYSQLSTEVFEAYTTGYGMTVEQAETYRIHGPMDRTHAERSLAVLDEAENRLGWKVIEQAVRDAFVATSLHYDGMLHAATGQLSYWNGGRT